MVLKTQSLNAMVKLKLLELIVDLDRLILTNSVQTLQSTSFIYKRYKFVYHQWVYTSNVSLKIYVYDFLFR